MSLGGSGSEATIESDKGAGPATVEPPSAPANQSTDDPAIDRLTDEGEAAARELKLEFRRKLAGLRWLPRTVRAGARRELYNWLRAALKALQERKAVERRAALQLRRRAKATRYGATSPAKGPTT